MKNFFLILLLIGGTSLFAQKQEATVQPPKIVCKLQTDEMANFGDYSVKFIEVISDSRCPENVTCVWAGEAKILVGIYKNGSLIKQKTLTFPSKEEEPLFNSKELSLEVYSLTPYPKDNPIRDESVYRLNLTVTTPEK